MMRKRKGIVTYLLVGLLALGLLLPSGVALADEPEAITPVEKSVFTDVNDNHDQLVYINYINARNIMNGFPDGSFNPAAGLTRAEAAVIMCKTANLNTQDQEAVSAFTDVTTEHWAYNYINAAVKAGYLQGLGDGTYQPDASLTRAQAISLILRLSTSKDSGVPLPALNDMDIDHWAARAMAMAIDAQMITSKGNNIQPDQSISRGDITQALAILLTREPNLASVPLYGILKVNSGEVMLSRSGQEAELVTSARQVEAGDTIKTLDKASAQINFPDGSSLLLKPKSELTIQTAQGRAYIKQNGKPGTAIDDLQIKLQVGTMFGALSDLTVATMEDTADEDATVTAWKKGLTLLAANTDTPEAEEPPWYKTAEKKKVKVKVDMPWGVAAIRGTFWQNTVDDDGSGSMSVLQGSGSVTSGGQTTNIDPGQSTNGAPAQPPTPPAPMTPEQARGWAGEQGWVNSTVGNMSNNVGAPPPSAPTTNTPATNTPTNIPPPAPSQMMENLNQNINNAMQQVQQTVQANTPPSQSSGGSSSGGSSLPSALFDFTYDGYDQTPVTNPTNITSYITNEGFSLVLTSNINGITYTLTSSNEQVAMIDEDRMGEDGNIYYDTGNTGTTIITITASAPGHQNYTRTINLTVMEYNPGGFVLERIIVNDEGSGVDHTVYDSLTFKFNDDVENLEELYQTLYDSLSGSLSIARTEEQSNYFASVEFLGLGNIQCQTTEYQHGHLSDFPSIPATVSLNLTAKEIIFVLGDGEGSYSAVNILKNFSGGNFTLDNSDISLSNNAASLPLITAYVNADPVPDYVSITCETHESLNASITIRLWKEMGESKSYLNKDYSEPDYTNSWNSDSNDSWFTLSPIESVLNISFFELGIFHYIDIQINVGEDVYTLINVGNVHFVW